MDRYIGIDLGTSSVKTLLIGENGIEKSVSRDYPVQYPQTGWSEQEPLDWYSRTVDALKELIAGTEPATVRALAFSGQMHGLVMLDRNDESLRPAILWNDGRSVDEVATLNGEVGESFLLRNTGNIAFAGFTAPKLMWVRKHEPQIFSQAVKIMLPKDYLAYRFTGVFATDVSDASGTLYFDVRNRCWSRPMLDLLGIDESVLPAVHESREVIGTLLPALAAELGLPDGVAVVIGGGDNACSAVGTGAVRDGDCNLSLGTSGTIFVETKEHRYDEHSAIHAFCSASGAYHYLACILSAASCQKWWRKTVLGADYDFSGAERWLGKNEVLFLPYLMGERSPINDPQAKAMFYGMSMNTTADEMSLAVLEGVAFALKQNLEIIRSLGVNVTTSAICGGGAKNALWLRIVADCLNVTLQVPDNEEGGALGAALLAAQGVLPAEEYRDFAGRFYGVRETVEPEPDLVAYYDERFGQYLQLYRK